MSVVRALTNQILYFLQIDSGNGSTYFTKAGYYCHEKFDDIDKLLNSVRFWIEGVSLTIIAVFGLLGNLLTIVVFRNYDRYDYAGCEVSSLEYKI